MKHRRHQRRHTHPSRSFQTLLRIVPFVILVGGCGGCRAPIDSDTALRQADAAAGNGDWKAAEIWARKALRGTGENLEARILHGIALYHLGRVDDARAELERAAAVSPDDYQAQLWYGWLMCELGEYEEALEALEKAWKIRPGGRDHMVLLARACLELNLLRGASYLQGLRRFPEFRNSVELYNDLGVLWIDHGNLKKGFECLEQALRIQPENPIVLQNLAVAWDNWGKDPHAALKFYRYALAVSQRLGDKTRAARIRARLRQLSRLRTSSP